MAVRSAGGGSVTWCVKGPYGVTRVPAVVVLLGLAGSGVDLPAVQSCCSGAPPATRPKGPVINNEGGGGGYQMGYNFFFQLYVLPVTSYSVYLFFHTVLG